MFNGTQVRKLREERGFSLAELAQQAGISISYLSELERGSKKPSLKMLEKLSHSLNISTRELMQGGPEEGIGLGTRIRMLREEQGLSLQDLATAAGLSYSYICEIERGLVDPSLRALRKIADSINVPVSRLKGQVNTMGNKISRVREEFGMKQSQLARKAGLSPGMIGQLEQGKVQPSLQTVEKIAAAFGISPCYFIAGDDGMEDFLHLLTPELRDLIMEPQVQAILRSICHCSEKEIRFILEFIRMFKESRLEIV